MNIIEEKTKKSILKNGFKLSILTFGSRILGLIREMTKASFLGTSSLSDAFGIAFLIPNLLRRLFAENSVSVAFIPTFRAKLEAINSGETTKEETQNFVSATFTLITFLTSIVVILGIIFTPIIVRITAGKEAVEMFDEAVILTRIMFPYLIIISISALFQGILNGLKIFSPSGFTPILFNAIVIAATYLLSPFTANPARAMSIGVTAGGLVQALFQLPFILKNNWHISLTSIKTAFTNPGTRKVMKLVGPTILGMAAYQLNDLVSTGIASRTGEGILSSLQYSLRLQELILGIFAVTIGTIILPDLSSMAKNEKWQDFNKMLSQAMKTIALITIPVTFFSLIQGENLISLIYKNQKFTDESVRLTLNAFVFHISGLYFIALNRIIAPSFYAQSDAKSPTFCGLIGFTFNIILAIVLAKPMKGGGIALALSFSSLINTIALLIFLNRSKNIDVKTVVKQNLLYSLKMIIFSAIASVPIYFLNPIITKYFANSTRLIAYGLPLVICCIIFFAIGILLLAITKDPLLKEVIKTFTQRSKKRKNND